MSEELTKRCPECGCAEYTHKDEFAEGFRVCAKCGQDWWTDVNYTDNEDSELIAIDKDKQIAELKAELETAITERNILAMLSSEKPIFFNPRGIFEAKKLRDRILYLKGGEQNE